MTEKPKILEKVEELSDLIADLGADQTAINSEINIDPIKLEDEDSEELVFDFIVGNDFRVRSEDMETYCRCDYGGENIHCYARISDNGTLIYTKDDPSQKHDSLFNSCILRQYLTVLAAGLRRKKND
jgi:hypothetical protein